MDLFLNYFRTIFNLLWKCSILYRKAMRLCKGSQPRDHYTFKLFKVLTVTLLVIFTWIMYLQENVHIKIITIIQN